MHKTLVDDWLASKERVVLPDMQPLENYDGIHAPVENVEKMSAMPEIDPKLKEVVASLFQLKYFKEEVDQAAGLPVLGPYKTTTNEAVYMGQFKDGLRHGRGIQIEMDKSIYEVSIFEGIWEKGKTKGYGRKIYSNGHIYEGNWLDSKSHGFGVYLHTDGHKYSGQWLLDNKHGRGYEEWPEVRVYDGFWQKTWSWILPF